MNRKFLTKNSDKIKFRARNPWKKCGVKNSSAKNSGPEILWQKILGYKFLKKIFWVRNSLATNFVLRKLEEKFWAKHFLENNSRQARNACENNSRLEIFGKIILARNFWENNSRLEIFAKNSGKFQARNSWEKILSSKFLKLKKKKKKKKKKKLKFSRIFFRKNDSQEVKF